MNAGLLASGDGSILLQPDLDNDPRLNTQVLHTIWNTLRQSSVDVAISHSHHSSIYEFAANECIFLASILHMEELPPISLDTVEEGDEEGPSPTRGEIKQAWYEYYQQLNHPPDKALTLATISKFGVRILPKEITPTPVSRTVGIIYITPSHILGEVGLGVAIAAAHRGKGFARTAITLLLSWAFERAGYHRVQAAVMLGPTRERALRLFTGLRFNHEGTRRRQVLDVFSNEYKDVTYLGLLDTTWMMRHYYPHIPHNLWDELFARHQREREDLLAWEMSQSKLKRTQSMETVRVNTDEVVESDYGGNEQEDGDMESSQEIPPEELTADQIQGQTTWEQHSKGSVRMNGSGESPISEGMSPSPELENNLLRDASCSPPPPSESSSSSSTWENISEGGHSSASSSWDRFEDPSLNI